MRTGLPISLASKAAVTVRATLTVKGRAVATLRATSLPAGRKRTLRLQFTARSRSRLRREHGRISGTLKVTAVTASGQSRTTTRTVRLR